MKTVSLKFDEILTVMHLPVTTDDECFSISYLRNEAHDRKHFYSMKSHQVPIKRPKLMLL